MNTKDIIEKCKNAYDKNNEIIIYGAGLAAHLIYNSLINKWGIQADYFCTSFEAEHIDRSTHLTVLNRESLEFHSEALIIVAIGITFSEKTYNDIENYVIDSGISRENLVIETHDWIVKEAKPYIGKDGKLNVYTLSFHVTKQCNLKCKMCGQLLFGPVKRRSFPSEQIIHDTDVIFELIDHIEVLKLIGGEVLAYAKLDELITYLNQYRDKIRLLEIYTNGAIFPNSKLLDSIVGYKGDLQVTISDYGELSIAKRTWLEFGKNNNIRINVLGFGTKEKSGYKGWIDCTETKDLGESEEELELKYKGCGQRLDYVLEDSILATCTSFHMLNYALGKELNKEECVYINDESSNEEKRKKIVALGSDDKYLDICRYCVWRSSIRDKLPRYPAAEQMK